MDNATHLSQRAFVLSGRPSELRTLLAQHPYLRVDLYRDPSGYTSLHTASQLNARESVSLLLDHQADINARTWQGNTSLILAVSTCSVNCALVLMERGADVHFENASRQDALSWALVLNLGLLTTMLLCCGADTKLVMASNFNLNQALADYSFMHEFIENTHHVLRETLSTYVWVDNRIGLRGIGIYQEPLDLTLEYLGLSVNHDQVVNTSMDGTARRRVLIPNQARNAKYWYMLAMKQRKRDMIQSQIAFYINQVSQLHKMNDALFPK